MNEFKYLAEVYAKLDLESELLALSMRRRDAVRTALQAAHQPGP